MVLKVGSGDIDDLSTLNVLDEESLLRELRARYKKGIIYVGHWLVRASLLYPLSLTLDLHWRCTDCHQSFQTVEYLRETGETFICSNENKTHALSCSNMICTSMCNTVVNCLRTYSGWLIKLTDDFAYRRSRNALPCQAKVERV